MHRIVIIGAGTGGTLTANLLVKALRKQLKAGDVTITVVEARHDHAFQPGNLDVAFRGKDPQSFLHPVAPLLDKRITYLEHPAKRVDADGQSVHLSNGDEVGFDHLVLATGADGRPDLLPGLEGVHTFHQGPEVAARIWDDVRDLKAGKVVVAITEMPYKCPPSPNEACFLLDEHFRKQGVRDDVEITMLTPMPRAYPAEAVSRQVEERFKQKGIGLETFFMAAEVDAAGKKIISMEGTEIPYDVLIAIPPHRGVPLITDSGLGDAEGWVPIDKETMRVKGHEALFALGDCTDAPISKSGVVAHLQSLVVVKNILADLGIEDSEWTYDGRINCPMEVGDHRLLWVQATYAEAPKENQPTMVKYGMKKAFNKMYWKALGGDLEWMFKLYFGETAQPKEPDAPELMPTAPR